MRIRTDNWIDVGIVLSWVVGTLLLILGFVQMVVVFMWLGFGLWCVGGSLRWWKDFRRAARSMQRSEEEQQRDTPAIRIGRLLLGIGLILVGVLGPLGLDSLFHQWWVHLLDGGWSTACTVTGAVLIVQAVKSTIKRDRRTDAEANSASGGKALRRVTVRDWRDL